MAVILSRDPALTVQLLSTYGTATLLGEDGRGVQVSLAHLLGASSLVRSIVDSSQLHPGVHGPLIISFDIAVDILAHVGEILGTGESKLKSGNIEDVVQVLEILGLEGSLSETRLNIENHEQQVAANEEGINLEEVIESIGDEDTESGIAGTIEAKEVFYGQCYAKMKNYYCVLILNIALTTAQQMKMNRTAMFVNILPCLHLISRYTIEPIQVPSRVILKSLIQITLVTNNTLVISVRSLLLRKVFFITIPEFTLVKTR